MAMTLEEAMRVAFDGPVAFRDGGPAPFGPQWPDAVQAEDLACLNWWPAGSLGEMRNEAVIVILNELCRRHGYGMVPATAKNIRRIWYRRKKVITILEKEKREHLDRMAETRDWLKRNGGKV